MGRLAQAGEGKDEVGAEVSEGSYGGVDECLPLLLKLGTNLR